MLFICLKQGLPRTKPVTLKKWFNQVVAQPSSGSKPHVKCVTEVSFRVYSSTIGKVFICWTQKKAWIQLYQLAAKLKSPLTSQKIHDASHTKRRLRKLFLEILWLLLPLCFHFHFLNHCFCMSSLQNNLSSGNGCWLCGCTFL